MVWIINNMIAAKIYATLENGISFWSSSQIISYFFWYSSTSESLWMLVSSIAKCVELSSYVSLLFETDTSSFNFSMFSMSNVSNAFFNVNNAIYSNTKMLTIINIHAGKNRLTATPTTPPEIKIGWNNIAIS